MSMITVKDEKGKGLDLFEKKVLCEEKEFY